MENPHVDVIGHLTGRKINKRGPMHVDLERVFAAAVETGTALEINSQPDRLDLRDADARLAGERGVRIVVSTDAALDVRARLRDARDRPGAPRVADEGAGRQHAAVVEGEGEEVTFREDGHRARRLGRGLPRARRRAARARAGQAGRDPRAAAARRRPSRPEPFEAVLRDLDEILLPGVTHWQHPRFFAYFAVSAAEPGILAELLAATLNSVGDPLADGAGLDRARAARLRLGRAADRPPERLARPHRGHARRRRRSPR